MQAQINRIILSRKGFDSQYGKIPSPIFPDGTLFSFPIPDDEKGVQTYEDLYCKSAGKSVAQLLNDLTGESFKQSRCHFDPDINRDTIIRTDKWKALFGQSGPAQGHLQNNGVGINDIFLFFGRFRPVEEKNKKWQFIKGTKDKHLIFGYLQVGKIINLFKGEETLPWMAYHPHVNNDAVNNTLYVASNNLSFFPELEGANILKYDVKRVLTKDGFSASRWDLPKDIFGNIHISYHSPKSWKNGYFQSAAKGQEFIITASKKVIDWAVRTLK